MRQVFLQKGAVVVKEVCQPVMDEYEVLVAVHYSFISSGTEAATIAQAEQNPLLTNVSHKIKKVLESVASHGLEGTAALIKSKLKGESQALGYSCSGRVIAVGDKVRQVRVGDYVACAGAGYAHHADLVCVPEHLVVRVQKEVLKQASITTIGAIALQGVRQANLQLGETVCVMGLGLLGQLTVQLAKQSGCRVIGVDLLADRLRMAEKFGADRCLTAGSDLAKEIAYLTDHYGVDATIITAAAKEDCILQTATECTRKKGAVVLVGDVNLTLERSPFYQKELDLRISCSYGPGRYDPNYEQRGIDYPYAYVRWTEQRNMQAFVHLLASGQIDIAPLIGYEATLDTVDQAYERIKAQSCLGALLSYDAPEQVEFTQKMPDKKIGAECTFIPARKDLIRVGMIGAGGFAKVKLMPIIAKLKKTKINAIADADIATSINAQKVYGAAKACSDYNDLLTDDVVDALVIASPHKFHCAQALDALHSGKAVFLEKPMVTNWKQLEQFKTFLNTHPAAPLCVDYNRSFAPLITKIKKALVGRATPIVAHYRMNAGLIKKDHWVQTDIGAGRIIGEACHIIDLFYYLTDSKPISVSVETVHSTNEHVFPTDNFTVQLSFQDGSICSLLYTSIGSNKLSKERLELFFDGKAIVMDDFRQLKGYGLPAHFDTTCSTVDKGHAVLLEAFFKALRKSTYEPPISFERLEDVAHMTLIIDALACKGGGTQDVA